MRVKYVLRLDDVCQTMHWEHFDRLMDAVQGWGIRPLLGVIPNNQDPDFKSYEKRDDAWARMAQWQARGAEIAMHGYEHVWVTKDAGYFAPDPKSEFAGSPLMEQRRRLRLGYDILRGHELNPCAFMAPAHSLDDVTIEALCIETPIRIVTDGVALFPYIKNGVTFVPAMIRRTIVPIGIRTLVVHPNTMPDVAFDDLLLRIKQRCQQFISLTEAARLTQIGLADLLNRAAGECLQTAVKVGWQAKQRLVSLRQV